MFVCLFVLLFCFWGGFVFFFSFFIAEHLLTADIPTKNFYCETFSGDKKEELAGKFLIEEVQNQENCLINPYLG